MIGSSIPRRSAAEAQDQVFLSPEGHYRVRLTHTLDVSQIAGRCPGLRLNEDLTGRSRSATTSDTRRSSTSAEQALTPFLGNRSGTRSSRWRVVDHLENDEED